LTSSFPKAKVQSPPNMPAADQEPIPVGRSSTGRQQASSSTSPRGAAATGYIAPMTNDAAVQSTGNNFKGRLAAWSATTHISSSPSPQERHLPDIPSQHARTRTNEQASPSIRQTAISITSGFSSGLAKRAVEKMGRAWGGIHSGPNSVNSSASSTYTAPSSFSDPSAEDLGRSNVPQSKHFAASLGHTSKSRARRTPNAPSGAWSVTSSATSSSISGDSDAYSTPIGPVLGKRMRGPTRSTGVGAVFGRDLRSCVAETALHAVSSAQTVSRPTHNRTTSGSKAQKEQDNRELEARRVPALVVRCAQHILAWGVQEEGLFRYVSYRPLSLLRSDVFDLQPHWASITHIKTALGVRLWFVEVV
jgi:hypothetical protein